MSSKLFTPLKVGRSQLHHRVVMAPLTRFRASDSHVPLPMVAEYYSQRASVPGTLLITEATFISPKTAGYNNVPGIWNDDQIASWKHVTDAVHEKGSYIYLQLWNLGRTPNPEVLKKHGYDVAAPSPIPYDENAPVPRELTEDEIQAFIQDYATAAKNAVEKAGFDGVEIHGANGYLIDQFFQDVSNQRTDGWGGSVEKRARFGLEVTKAVVDAVGSDRTGIRLSPWSTFQGMRMKDPLPQFSYVVEKLKALDLAYIHFVESRVSGNADQEPTGSNDPFIDIWANQSPVLLAGGFKPDSAVRDAKKYEDKDLAIVFGRYFISTPDLPFRLQHGVDFEPYDRDTFYVPKSEKGYIDYPFSKEFLEAGSLKN